MTKSWIGQARSILLMEKVVHNWSQRPLNCSSSRLRIVVLSNPSRRHCTTIALCQSCAYRHWSQKARKRRHWWHVWQLRMWHRVTKQGSTDECSPRSGTFGDWRVGALECRKWLTGRERQQIQQQQQCNKCSNRTVIYHLKSCPVYCSFFVSFSLIWMRRVCALRVTVAVSDGCSLYRVVWISLESRRINDYQLDQVFFFLSSRSLGL